MEKQNEELEKESSTHKALDSLTRMLAIRDHSILEIKQKLGQKGYSSKDIEIVIEFARQSHWLADPDDLAERTADSLDRKGKSGRYIQHYLQKKGLPQVEFSEDREMEKARDLIQRKFGEKTLNDFESRGKAAKWLEQRGFQSGIIGKVIHEKS